jgi:hypothetical protein
MTYTMTVKTQTAAGTTVERFTATADELPELREQARQNAPHGSTQTITVK